MEEESMTDKEKQKRVLDEGKVAKWLDDNIAEHVDLIGFLGSSNGCKDLAKAICDQQDKLYKEE